MSARVMNILADFSPEVEVYSIDESFLKLDGFENYNLYEYGTKMRSRVLKWTGIPTCVGIAPTKALCKVANKIARSNLKQSKGICIIDSEEKRIKALKWTKIGNVWGIGSRLKKRLQDKGCFTAWDFTQLPSDWVLKNFSIVAWRLQKDLQGISKIPMEVVSSKKMIATTRSFKQTYSDIENIKERISTFATRCAEKLRKQESSCHMLIVQLSSDRHKTDAAQHRESKTVIFSHPTDSTLTISNAAVAAVKSIFKPGIKYKRAGVIVTGLVPNDNFQLNLFTRENPKHKPLMVAIDALNKKFKADKIKLGNQDLKHTWKMRQERLSAKFTTNINDVIIVK
jgi:DNA polymerase V